MPTSQASSVTFMQSEVLTGWQDFWKCVAHTRRSSMAS